MKTLSMMMPHIEVRGNYGFSRKNNPGQKPGVINIRSRRSGGSPMQAEVD